MPCSGKNRKKICFLKKARYINGLEVAGRRRKAAAELMQKYSIVK